MVVEDRLDEMRDEGYCYIIVSKYSLELIYWIDHLFFYVSVIGLRFFFFLGHCILIMNDSSSLSSKIVDKIVIDCK